MRPSHPIRHILLAAATTLGATVALAPPANAVQTITATSVALNAGSCAGAAMDMGVTGDDPHHLTGLATSYGPNPESFSPAGAVHWPDGPWTRYWLADPGSALPEGSVIGLYATIGTAPDTAATTAEFFILYRCSFGGPTVLQTCYGPLGTCPTTANEAKSRPPLTLDPSATTEPPTTEAPPTEVPPTAGPTTMVPPTTAAPGTTPGSPPAVSPATGARPRSGKPTYTG